MDKGGVSKGRRNSNNEDEENLCSGKCCCKWMKDNVLLIMIVTGVVLGLLIGFLLKLHSDIEFTAKEIAYISFPGVIFLNMLKMIIIPLIFTSVTAGLAVLDTKSSGKLGGRTMLYYICTTVMAVILGIILVVSIKPGKGSPDDVTRAGSSKKVEADDAFMDLIRNMVPPNLIAACFETYRTSLVPVAPEPMPSPEPSNMTTLLTTGMMMSTDNATTLPMTPTVVYKSQGGYVDGSNILGIITFSIVLGVVISKMGPKGAILIHFFVALNDAIMRIVWLVMWFAPFGIMFLIMGRVLLMDDWSVIGGQLGMYMVTVITGLLIHGLIVLPLLYVIFTRKNPIRFFLGVLPAILTAFGTASSSATLPVTIRCVEENLRVDKRVAQFVLPIGATINMDGTALYEAVAAIFIAQLNNYDLDIGQYITISITATMASIGAAGIPEAGLVTTVLVLTAVGLPVEDVALLLVIDWLIDRIRTAVNVFGDSTGAGIIEKYTTYDLEEDSKEEEFDAIEAGYYDNKAKHNYGYKNSDNFDTPL
ncbi:excitatory amino acid transporter 3-like [Ptychodera flava]|uniref:excitatory amino acid transporter 3-like n=1 Tax=Ptychodera flava TaxID=63121 RepID=UPI003969C0F7